MPGAGGRTMGDTAGFTSPEFNVSHVDVVPISPDEGALGKRQEAITAPSGAGLASTATGPSLGHGVLMPESMSSIIVICLLWAVRVYFVLIVMSYARLVLRRHVANMSRNSTQLYTPGKGSNLIENPFAMHLPEGKGWKGRLGRFMVGVARSYWLGTEEGDDAWMNDEIAMGRVRRKEGFTGSEVPGVVERERRRRSGTGPPPPPQLQGHGQHLRVQEVRDGK